MYACGVLAEALNTYSLGAAIVLGFGRLVKMDGHLTCVCPL